MAVKKSKPAETAAKPAPAKKAAATKTKAAATKTKAAAPAPVAPEAPAKAETSKKTAAPKKAAAAAPKKAAAVVKLTENQLKFLKQIHEAKDGFTTAKKAELNTLEALLLKKLVKKGAKDKASGQFRFTVSKAGEKHL